MVSLRGKSVLITGASSGIGEGIAVHFASLGAKLTLGGRNQDSLSRVSGLCVEAGAKPDEILTVQGDINQEEWQQEIVNKCVEKYEGIDVLINNAGMIHYSKISESSQEQYDDLFNTNVRSHVFLSQRVIPYLKSTKGNIVNISSICGPTAMPGVGVYCMSKAAMDSFTKCLALELAPFGVRVNAINPGTIVSNLARRDTGAYKDDQLYEKFLDFQATIHPLGRVGLPVDCAEAAAFLASESASFITGQLLFVDGGRNCVSPSVKTDVK